MLTTIAIAVAVSLITWYFFIRPHSYWTKLGVKQTKPRIFFGDSWETLFKRTTIYDFVYRIYNMHPGTRYSGLYNFNKPIFVPKDPELIKQITVKDFEHFTDRPPFIDPDADPLWSSNLFALRGERWKYMRNILSPSFTTSKIKSLYIFMSETAENFVKHFLEKDDDIIEIEMKDSFTRLANDVIATTSFGIEVNSLKDKTNIFYEMGKKLTQFRGIRNTFRFMSHSAFPKLSKILGISFLDKDASKYFSAAIEDTIKAREERNIVRSDMLHLMLEARKDEVQTKRFANAGRSKATAKISNGEIASQAMVFFFAGFDTVSTAMSFGTYELALNKDIQDRLREEIIQTQKDGKVTYEQLMQMKYMDMVVSEILRKWPPFPQLNRICTKPFTIEPVNKDEKPIPIKLNQEIFIPIYGIQRDPKWFPNPDKFDPERFSDENKNNIASYTVMSFGVGPRICIGNRFALLEVKALLFNLLLHFELVPTKKTQIPLILSKEFSPIPYEGIWLGLKRIKS